MAKAKDTPPVDLPPVEVNPEEDPNHTPPVPQEDSLPDEPTPRKGNAKEIEISRVPSPTLTGGRVVYPGAYGFDYTVDDDRVTGGHPMKGDLKVVAVARPGFRFAKGLTRTFNLKKQ